MSWQYNCTRRAETMEVRVDAEEHALFVLREEVEGLQRRCQNLGLRSRFALGE